jgi:hypothetical protein
MATMSAVTTSPVDAAADEYMWQNVAANAGLYPARRSP